MIFKERNDITAWYNTLTKIPQISVLSIALVSAYRSLGGLLGVGTVWDERKKEERGFNFPNKDRFRLLPPNSSHLMIRLGGYNYSVCTYAHVNAISCIWQIAQL